MNNQPMFYVFNKEDCDRLRASGFKLLKSFPEKDMYLFLNNPANQQIYSKMKVKFTRQLSF